MKYDIKAGPFDKVMMTGVFLGIIVTIVALAFDAAFLESTGFPFTSIINVSSLIFSITLLFMVIAVIYYGLSHWSKYGSIIFIGLFVLVTVLLLIKVANVHRTDNQHLNHEFRQLLSIIILMVAAGAIFLPFLVNNRKFREHVI